MGDVSPFVSRLPWSSPPVSALEVNGGDFVTEQSGYMSTEQLVTDMLKAGKALEDYRNGMYDLDEEADWDEDVPLDPTRRKDFDLADFTALKLRHEQKLEEYKAQKKADEEAKKKAQDESEPPAKTSGDIPPPDDKAKVDLEAPKPPVK